jgi:NADPH2:quinone reductase
MGCNYFALIHHDGLHCTPAKRVDIQHCLACAAHGAVISSYAVRDVGEEVSLPMLKAMTTGCVFRFVSIYHVPQAMKDIAVADITACLRDRAYAPLLGLSVPLDRIADAHLAQERRDIPGKILVEIRSSQ